MTPKEKAEQLVYGMYHIDIVNLSEYGMEWNMAKQCALIAIDEILEAIKGMVDEFSGYSAYEYYINVKEEIEKL